MRSMQTGRYRRAGSVLAAILLLGVAVWAYTESLVHPPMGGVLVAHGPVVWSAANATDQDTRLNSAYTWLCAVNRQLNYLTYRFEEPAGTPVERSFNRFDLFNYGNNRSIRRFQIFTSSDPAVESTPDGWLHPSWQRATPSAQHACSEKMNLLQRAADAQNVYITNTHATNTIENAVDGSVNTLWLGRFFPNDIVFRLNGGTPILFDTFGMENYNHPRSIRHFVLYATNHDGASTDPSLKATAGNLNSGWVQLMPAPGDGSGDPWDYLNPLYYGNLLGTSGFTQTPERATDGSTSTVALFRGFSSIAYSFLDEEDTERARQFHRWNVTNDNHPRSIRHALLLASSSKGPTDNLDHPSWNWTRIPPHDASKADPASRADLLNPFFGSTVVVPPAEVAGRPFSNVIDGNYYTVWVGAMPASGATMQFDTGAPKRVMNRLAMHNYNSTISVREFRLYHSDSATARDDPDAITGDPATGWAPILPPPGSPHGSDEEVNILAASQGATLHYYTGARDDRYTGDKAHDEHVGTLWYSNHHPNSAIFSFPGDVARDITRFQIENWGDTRYSVLDFRIFTTNDDDARTDPDHASWTLVAPPAAHASDTHVDHIHLDTGGILWGSSSFNRDPNNAHDGNTGTIWSSRDFPASITFGFGGGTEPRDLDRVEFSQWSTGWSGTPYYPYNVKHFQVFVTNDDAARDDPDHPSWKAGRVAPHTDVAAAGLVDLLHPSYGGKIVESLHTYLTWSHDRLTDQRHNGNTASSTRVWLTRINQESNPYVVFSLGHDLFNPAAPPEGAVVNKLALRNYDNDGVGSHNRNVQTFKLWHSPDNATWTQVAGPGADGVFTAVKGRHIQEYAFPAIPAAQAKYIKFEIISNYGDATYAGLRKIHLYGTATLPDFDVFEAESQQAFRSYAFAAARGNVKYVMFRMLTHYAGDADPAYANHWLDMGIREMRVLGPETYGDHGYWRTPDHQRGPYDFTPTAALVGKYFQFRMDRNYQDSKNWMGIRELRAWGSTKGRDLGNWIAELAALPLQEFDFDTVEGRYFQFRPVSTHGSTSVGLRTLHLYGTRSLADENAFHLPQDLGPHDLTFDPVTAKYFRMVVLDNYGDPQWSGLRTMSLFGDKTLAELGVFEAGIGLEYQSWFLPIARTAKYFRLSIHANYGDAWTGVRELHLYGNATGANFGVFHADRDGAWHSYHFDTLEGTHMQLRTLASHGDRYCGAREIRLYRGARLHLADTSSGELDTHYTTNRTVKYAFSELPPGAAAYRLSEDASFATYVPKGSPTGTYHLSDGQGVKTVHAMILDAGGSQLSIVKSQITLDSIPPDPVSNLRAEPGTEKITLFWSQPSNADFSRTVVRFSTSGYPSGPSDGSPLPNGNDGMFFGSPGAARSFEHLNLPNGVTHYYAFFTFDQAGNQGATRQVEAAPNYPVAHFVFRNASGGSTFEPGISGETQGVTLVAIDHNGNRAVGYEGTQNILFESEYANPSSGTRIPQVNGTALPATLPIDFVAGQSVTFQVAYADAGQIRIHATDTRDTPDPSDDIRSDTPAQLTYVPFGFDVQWIEPPVPPRAGESLQLRIRAVASDGTNADLSTNPVTPNYQTGDPQGIALAVRYRDPASGERILSPDRVRIEGGSGTFSVQYPDAGTIALDVTDAAYYGQTISGTLPDTRFYPYDFLLEREPYPGNRDFFYAARDGEPFGATITARNAQGEACANYRGTILFGSGDSEMEHPDPYPFTGGDAGRRTWTSAFRSGSVNDPTSLVVMDRDHPHIRGEAEVRTLYPDARLHVVGTTGPLGTLRFFVDIRQGPGEGERIRDDTTALAGILITGETGPLSPQSARISRSPGLNPGNLGVGARHLPRERFEEGGRITLYGTTVEPEEVRVLVRSIHPALHPEGGAEGVIVFEAPTEAGRGATLIDLREIKTPRRREPGEDAGRSSE